MRSVIHSLGERVIAMVQLGFADAFLGRELGRNQRLDRIDGLIDWAAVGRILGRLESAEGRPPYAPLSMFKALLLQQWYGLSDPGLEEALLDRLSFRRFCAFALDGETPDETTICRFRARLVAASLGEILFAEIARQLEARGFILKAGTLIDATLVQASVRPPQSRAPAGGEAPVEHSSNPLDPDAGWTRTGESRRLFFGYKAHIGVDQGSGLIRSRKMTPARTYESEVADALILGDERAVYADRAYEKRARREAIKARGAKDRIMHRRNKHHDLTPWQKRRNKLIARVRGRVEGVFGTWKRVYGFTRTRYRGLLASALQLDLLCISFNLRRAERLIP
jgi:IS5 family transposase